MSLKPIYGHVDPRGPWAPVMHDIKCFPCVMLLIHHLVGWALQCIFFLYPQMMALWTFECFPMTN